MKPQITREDVLREMETRGDQRVQVAVVDIDGVLRGKFLHTEKFKSVIDAGFGFCNVIFGWDAADASYANSRYTGWHTGYPDAHARIDPGTYRRIPWDKQIPFFLADFVDATGSPLAVCPRQALKRVIKKASDMGYEAKFGLEFEWFNFQETPQSIAAKHYTDPSPITPGMFGYSILRTGQNEAYCAALQEELSAFRVPIEGLHTETGPGVYEAALLYSDALEAADRGVLFKSGVKQIAHRFGILPSFMAKWNANLPGSSGHMHQSLWKNSESVFHTEDNPERLSALGRNYLAGQLACLADFLPFFAPTVNSYKRLVDGYWAPTRVTWGVENRTVAFRVIGPPAPTTRIENRVSGADINPYLAIAAGLAAGLYGIEKGLPLTAPRVEGNAYASDVEHLSRNLYEATMRLSQSKTANEMFGEEFIDHFVRTRLWEWERSQEAVTSWERERYFEII